MRDKISQGHTFPNDNTGKQILTVSVLGIDLGSTKIAYPRAR